MYVNFEPPEHDFVSKNVLLKGNLLVKSGDKLFIFGDKRAMHLLVGFYQKENQEENQEKKLISMSVWPDLEINKGCLIEENNVRLVITSKNQIFIRTDNGFFFEQKNITKRGVRKLINDINNEEVMAQNEDDEVIIDKVIHNTSK